ncbi:MAG: rod shape-determining protein MreC [Candidatus Omnitrophica bacterium]|nr:rod shape-determining protein MreC [Candidatus Omnitrophota bacterium]
MLFFLFFPLKDFFEYFFIVFSKRLLISPYKTLTTIEHLKKENLLLSTKLRQLEHLQLENEKLRKALSLKETYKINFIGAEIIGFDPSGWRKRIFLNVGSNRKIIPGMYVIDENGYLVGKVDTVKANYCRVLLIDDIEFSVPVFIEETAYGLLKGGLEGIKILYIEKDSQIKEADRVWIKLASSNFLIYIGKIKKIDKRDGELFLTVYVEPFSKNYFLHKFFIVQ